MQRRIMADARGTCCCTQVRVAAHSRGLVLSLISNRSSPTFGIKSEYRTLIASLFERLPRFDIAVCAAANGARFFSLFQRVDRLNSVGSFAREACEPFHANIFSPTDWTTSLVLVGNLDGMAGTVSRWSKFPFPVLPRNRQVDCRSNRNIQLQTFLNRLPRFG